MTNSKTVYFILQQNITVETPAKVIAAVDGKLKAGMTEACVLLASPGGYVDPGTIVYNYLRGIPVPVTTVNFGNVDSVATIIYCAGKRRLATRQCRFLIHGITWTISQPMTVPEQQVREWVSQIEKMKHNIAEIISVTTGVPVEKVTADMTAGLTLHAGEAKAYGLVHEFVDQLHPGGADVVVIQ